MRPSNKRSRNKQNRPRTLGNIVNRVFDSSGPEGKVRGTPQQIIDKYTLLARDAQLSGDRVAAENFLQHSEHYTRMLNEAQAEMAREAEQRGGQPGFQNGNQNGGQNGGQNGNQNGQPQNRRFDPRDDDGGQPDGDYAPPARQETRYEQPRQEQPRTEQPRSEQPRQNEPRVSDQRPNEPRSDQPRADQPREGRNDWKERRNKRFDERRARREAGDPRGEGQPEADSMLVETPEQRAEVHPALAPIAAPRAPVTPAEPELALPTPPEAAPTAEAAPAKPRGRPRKLRAEATEPAPAPDAAE